MIKRKKLIEERKKSIILISALSLLLLVAIVVATVFGVKYKNSVKELSNYANSISAKDSQLASQAGDYSSLDAEKSSEAESYENLISEKDSQHQSEVDKLNDKIEDLSHQLYIKYHSSTNAPSSPQTPPPPVATGDKVVYLTFDDGPSQYTPQILDILDRYGVKATFFVKNGAYNSTMKTIVDRGHQIGLHTYSHDYAKIYASDQAYYNDLQAIDDVVYNQTGLRTKIIRFPGGTSNTVSRKYCSGIMSRISVGVVEKGYSYFDWNCSNGDADGANTVDKQLSYVKQYSKSSKSIVVLMHDTKKATMESLPAIIEYFQSQGMTFGVLTPDGPAVRHKANN